MRAHNDMMAAKRTSLPDNLLDRYEKGILLQTLDQQWKEHLHNLDYLRQGIGLRAFGQRDPLNEYKAEAFELFQMMLAGARQDTVSAISRIDTGALMDQLIAQQQAFKEQSAKISKKA